MPTRITHDLQPCRKCGTPVARVIHKDAPKKTKSGYYFEWWFKCSGCRAIYMVEDAKRWFL